MYVVRTDKIYDIEEKRKYFNRDRLRFERYKNLRSSANFANFKKQSFEFQKSKLPTKLSSLNRKKKWTMYFQRTIRYETSISND